MRASCQFIFEIHLEVALHFYSYGAWEEGVCSALPVKVRARCGKFLEVFGCHIYGRVGGKCSRHSSADCRPFGCCWNWLDELKARRCQNVQINVPVAKRAVTPYLESLVDVLRHQLRWLVEDLGQVRRCRFAAIFDASQTHTRGVVTIVTQQKHANESL